KMEWRTGARPAMERAAEMNLRTTGITSLLRVACLERGQDFRVHEPAHVAPEHGDLAHEAGGNVAEMFGGREEHRLHVVADLAVHAGHLELVLEVGHGAQPADDDADALLLRELDHQAL